MLSITIYINIFVFEILKHEFNKIYIYCNNRAFSINNNIWLIMNKNYNSEKIFLKNICLISIFLFLIFLTKYSFCDDELVVNGLTNSGSVVTCNLDLDTNNCILNIESNDDLVASGNDIYIDTSSKEYDSKELNLVINQNCNIYITSGNGLNNNKFMIGTDDDVRLNFNSIIINDSSTVVFQKLFGLNYEFRSLINNVYVNNNSTLKFRSNSNVINCTLTYNNVNVAGANSILLSSININLENTNLYIDSTSNLDVNFNISSNCGLTSVDSLFNDGINIYENSAGQYIGFRIPQNKGSMIFGNVDNNGTIKIESKGVEFYADGIITNLNSSIVFLDYKGDKLPEILDNSSENIAYIKSCEDYSNYPFNDNYDYNLCRLYLTIPQELNSINLAINSDRVQYFIKSCENNFIPVENSSFNLYIPEFKKINPYLFGKIYDSGGVVGYSFDQISLKNLYNNNNSIVDFNYYYSIPPLFIFYKDNPISNIDQTSFLGSYNIFSILNYNNVENIDINLNYPFSIVNS